MMNHYRVKRAHDSRRIGTTFLSDSPRDALFMAMGFLQYLGNVEEVAAKPKVRKSRGIKVGTEPGGPAVVRDEGSHAAGGEDSQAG